MGGKEEEAAAGNSAGGRGGAALAAADSGFHIRKRVGYMLFALAVAAVVLVGLIVYYAGVAGIQCQVDPNSSGGAEKLLSKGDSGSQSGGKKKVTDVRLPRHLEAEHYKVRLVPFIKADNYTIRGDVAITMKCVESGSTNVTVHINDMTLDNDTITVEEEDNGRELKVLEHLYDADREFYIAKLDGSLENGKKYVMKINFVAQLRKGLRGFYRSTYKNGEGKDVDIATTQFQATDARRAFPCMDEPALKAKFEVSLGRTRNMTSISNMPIKSGGKGVSMEDDAEYVWDHYDTTVPMSTYLLAFVVSDFENELSPPTGNGIQFRIWARKNALDQIDYAKSIGAKMLKYFEDYFSVKYPLPKQDMIAIPDFSAGAMENWGLITYRETALLYKEGVSSRSNKQRIAIVVSHELAHQWFGNLVTPSWWTDLWLNEGFASYVEYLGVEAVQPEMKLMEQFVTMDLQSVMKIDALESSHPISIPVGHPDEISEIFDRISYAKGASIIRMMDHFLTTDTFRKGLANYLKAFEYKAAEQDDLWEHLTWQAHSDGTLNNDTTVKEIMDSWTLQMGFPVVNVERNYDDNTAIVNQKRYLTTEPKKDDGHSYKWWVPITFTEPGTKFDNTYSKVWIKPDDSDIRVTGLPASNTPAIFNVQETGFYRVNYDRKNWELIINQLKADHTKIHVINRAQIIDDALNLARAGHLDYELALGVTAYLNKETEYIPWKAALSGFSFVDIMLKRSAAYGEFQRYMTRQVQPLFERIGFEQRGDTDSHLEIFLRGLAVRWACKMGMPECIEKAKSKFKEWMEEASPDSNNPINVDLKRTVYCYAVAEGGEKEWDFGWERYQNSNVGSEKDNILMALGCSSKIWLLNRYLNMSLTPGSGVRQQDGRGVISTIALNTVGRDPAFNFIRDKWDYVLEYYAGSSFAIPGLVKNVLANRNTRFDVDQLIQFREENKATLGTGQREVEQAIEKGENNLQWMNDNYDTIHKFFIEQNRPK